MAAPIRRHSSPNNPAVSGARLSRYALVRQCMARYISPILVDSVLGKAMQSRGLILSTLSDEAIEAVVEESMLGLRLFVDPMRLPVLMLELTDILTGITGSHHPEQ